MNKPLVFTQNKNKRGNKMELCLKEIRNKMGYSIADVSSLSGISTGALSNYENGKRDIGLRKLQVLAKIYKCKMTDLFNCEEK